MSNDLNTMIDEWKTRISNLQKAHAFSAKQCEKYHYAIGVPATICATISGASLFSDINDPRIKLGVGVVGLIAAVLTAIQTFYSHAKQSERHRSSSSKLGRVRRDIEIFEQFTPQNKKEQEEAIRKINDEMGKIDEEAPIVNSMNEIILKQLLTMIKPLGKCD